MTDNFVYYALRLHSEKAIAKARELKMNPNSYNYKMLSDRRRDSYYMLLVIDAEDGAILNSKLFAVLSDLEAMNIHDAIVIN